ncbi:YIP1 family protein [Carboxylicivirga marina]|uniref:YIP1 family protein n=1 Tax=Carboxylicivirga marina TaxID=2800988 RepID=UPI0025942DCB|nr:YIP1 family protein [uncultured Carboxylicivirga sp.]
MNKVIQILYKPNYVFRQLDELYEEDLDTNSNLIASILGCLVGLYSVVYELENLNKIISGWWLVIACLIAILASSGFCVLIYNYILTYVLYWFGKLLGSRGVISDTRTAIVYSIIPITFPLILSLILKLIPETLLNSLSQYWILTISSNLIWIWTMIILAIGFKNLNKYGMFKAIINVLPIIAIGLIISAIRFL